MERGINRHTILGQVASTPQFRTLAGGSKSVRFRVMTIDRWVERLTGTIHQRRDWHLITAWDSLADRIQQEVREGMYVHIEGPVRTRKWMDDANQARYVTETHAMELIIVGAQDQTAGLPASNASQDGQRPSSGLPSGLLDTPVVDG